ncbi:hypothetical protein CUMW_262630 [Citrus unshiu]|uniref:Uncharacterized protein n=1 Tax=Citrus unshiu TaxID=55188 RepID=A0A2H5QUE7_CITUN|nr:hypothetical protein CUMW_262630 [Citrus unshiu]
MSASRAVLAWDNVLVTHLDAVILWLWLEGNFDFLPALPVLAQLIRSNDKRFLDGCLLGTLPIFLDGTNGNSKALIEARCLPRLVELLGHRSPLVLTAALRYGNIVMERFQTLCIINWWCTAVPFGPYAGLFQISDVETGNRFRALIGAGLIGPLHLLQNAEFDIKKRGCMAISNCHLSWHS